MRNLKKFLALVLAMMMVMGLMVTVNASVSIKTDADVSADYELAVEVLYKIGVLKGGTGGVYHPTDPISRAEFATMLYRLATSNTNEKTANSYKASAALFTDVDPNYWAAGVIGYAYENGLMKGKGSNTFDPAGEISGLEVVVGLGRVLGYDKNKELSGTGWDMQAALLARTSGIGADLADGVVLNASKAVTREDVAQMFFNTLLLPYVEYANGTYVKQEYPKASDGDPTVYVTPGDLMFNITYTDATGTADEFGRPGGTKTLTVNGTSYDLGAPDSVDTYESGEFTKDAADALKLTATNTLVWYNGQGWSYSGPGSADEQGSYNIGAMALTDTYGVNGYEVYVYAHTHVSICHENPNDLTSDISCSREYDVIVIEPWVAVVTDVNTTTGAVTVALLDGGNAYDTDIVTNQWTATKTISTTDELYSKVADSEEGDLFACYWNRNRYSTAINGIVDLVPMETETVSITAIDRKGTAQTSHLASITADGTVYDIAKAVVWTAAEDHTAFFNPGFAGSTTGSERKVTLSDATLYCLNGKVMVIDQSEATPETDDGYAYLYAVRTGENTNSGDWDTGSAPAPASGDPIDVKMILADGSDVTVSATNDATGANNTLGNAFEPTLVYYEVNLETNVYTLTKIAATTQTTVSTGELSITKGTPDGTIPNSNGATALNVVFDNNTIFFVMDDDGKVNTYKGITNVPSLDGVDSTTEVTAVNTADTPAGDGDTVKAILIVGATEASGAGSDTTADAGYFIVVDENATESSIKIGSSTVNYYVFNAVVDGEVTTVKVKSSATDIVGAGDTPTAGVKFFDKVTIDENGYITGKAAGATENSSVVDVKATTTGGTINVDDVNYLVDGISFYQYDTTAGTVKAISASDIKADTNGYVVMDGTTLVAVYVAKA